MDFETLSHQPDFELPLDGPDYPGDLISLIEEHYEGLHRVVVHKELRRNKYDYVAAVKCQENANKRSRPTATPEEICEYLMLIIQKDIDTTDVPGKYRFQIHGPPGGGSGPKKTKHIDFSDGDNIGKSVNVLDEATLLEQQSSYISELHTQCNSLIEYVTNMVQPIVHENREMMKIVTESQKRLADIETIRLRHELELRMHADEQKRLDMEAEERMQKWKQSLDLLKESGAVEAVLKAAQQFMAKKQEEMRQQSEKNKENREQQVREELREKQEERQRRSKKPKRGQKKASTPTPQPPSPNDEEKSQEQMEKDAISVAMEMPILILAAQSLKMTIESKDQWNLLEETLSEDQHKKFMEIFEADDPEEVSKLLKELYMLKGVKRLLELEKHLDKDQKKFVEVLMQEATS